MAATGLRLCVPLDKNNGAHFDVGDPHVQAVVLSWLLAGKIWYVHLATPCTQWSRARTTGNSLVGSAAIDFTVAVLNAVAEKRLLFTLENPRGSGLFEEPRVQLCLQRLACKRVLYDNCAFGANYKKSSELRTNVESLDCLHRLCPQEHAWSSHNNSCVLIDCMMFVLAFGSEWTGMQEARIVASGRDGEADGV